MGRVLGVDLGTRRIGLALSDPTGTLASPLAVLTRSGDPAADRRAILAAARDAGATTIVVGLPRSLSGREGPAARAARAEAAALAADAAAAAADGQEALTVHLADERFTTHTARRARREAGMGRRRGEPIDAAAAAVMLQAYLEATP